MADPAQREEACTVLTMWLTYLRAAARDLGDDRGLTTVEWVILIGIAAGMAVTAGAIIAQKVTDKANSIPGF